MAATKQVYHKCGSKQMQPKASRSSAQTGFPVHAQLPADPQSPSPLGPIEQARATLLAALAPLDRGAAASVTDRERVENLVRELENTAGERWKLNSGSQPLFNGSWRLVYSSTFAGQGPGSQGYSGTPPAPPGFTLGAVRQNIDLAPSAASESAQCDNQVEFRGPFGAVITATLEHSLMLDGCTSRITLSSVSVHATSDFLSLPQLQLPSISQFVPEQGPTSELEQRASSFDTTFLDDYMRISRSGLEELRIFIKDRTEPPVPVQQSDRNPDTVHPVKDDLPPAFQHVFADIRYWNSVQEATLPAALGSDKSLVVSAPTAAGKTSVFELCILQALQSRLNADGSALQGEDGSVKTVYLAPTKALVQEKVATWREKFKAPLALEVLELTGDSDMISWEEMLNVDIIVTTPEKFDSITRRNKSRGGMAFFGEVALLLIDEVHLLSEDRGPALEVVVSRLKMISQMHELQSAPISKIRFAACSATIPNAHDIGAWLNAPYEFVHTFGEEHRPIQLSTKVLAYKPSKNDFMFERKLNGYVFNVIRQFYEGRPVLVFCATRSSTQETAKKLCERAETEQRTLHHHPFLYSANRESRQYTIANKTLQWALRHGVAFHHGGVTHSDRNIVERLFNERKILVVCTTSTLALGVNLPAHLVVIKGTRFYDNGYYKGYSTSSLLQMIGRAGRPGHDQIGKAVIMTNENDERHYKTLLSNRHPVESTLASCLAEYLNSEIAIGTLATHHDVVAWIQTTFLYQRLLQNPTGYGIRDGDTASNFVYRLIINNMDHLESLGLVKHFNQDYIKGTNAGVIMAKYCLKIDTMEQIIKALENGTEYCTVPQLLMLLGRSAELSNMRLRRDEKKTLKELQQSATENSRQRIRFPLVGSEKSQKPAKLVKTSAEKVFLLVQEKLADMPGHDVPYSLKQEAEAITKEAPRIFGAIHDYAISQTRMYAAIASLKLLRSIRLGIWDGSQMEPRQVNGIGQKACEKLQASGITTLEQLACYDARSIERITGRPYPQGHAILNQVAKIPKAHIEMFSKHSTSRQTARHRDIILKLKREESNFEGHQPLKTRALLLCGTTATDCIKHHEQFILEQVPEEWTRSFDWTAGEGSVHAKLFFLDTIGRDSQVDLDMSEFEENNKRVDTVTRQAGNTQGIHRGFDLPKNSQQIESKELIPSGQCKDARHAAEHGARKQDNISTMSDEERVHAAHHSNSLRQSMMTESFPSRQSSSSASGKASVVKRTRTCAHDTDQEYKDTAHNGPAQEHGVQESTQMQQQEAYITDNLDIPKAAKKAQKTEYREGNVSHGKDALTEQINRTTGYETPTQKETVSWNADSPYVATDGSGIDTERVLEDLLM